MSGQDYRSNDDIVPQVLGINNNGSTNAANPLAPAGMHGNAVVQQSTGAAITGGATQGGNTIIPFQVALSGLTNADILTAYTPGFAFKIVKLAFWVEVAATTAAKAASVTAKISGTATTGGVVGLTSANCTPKGVIIAGTAITAANVGTASDTISLTASSVTAFVEGSGAFLLTLQDTETGALSTKVVSIDAALVAKGIVNNN